MTRFRTWTQKNKHKLEKGEASVRKLRRSWRKVSDLILDHNLKTAKSTGPPHLRHFFENSILYVH